MLLKNHDKESTNSAKLSDVVSQNTINSILYSDPFLKAGFLSKLVSETKTSILYIDLDLLYSGYVTSGTIPLPENLTLYKPTEDTIDDILTEILVKASTSQVLIIIDSINGLFNMLNYKKAGKTISSIVMFLTSIIRYTNSSIVIASMARYKKEEGWVLSPTGKRLVETKNGKKILLESAKEGIVVNLLNASSKILLPTVSILL